MAQQPNNSYVQQPQEAKPLQKGDRPIKRTKRHEAILKLKQTQQHIDMMKRRHQYLTVKDEQNRSKTIQHQRMILNHEKRRQQTQRDKSQLERYARLKMYELENNKQKNQQMKQERDKRIAQSLDKHLSQKAEAYQIIKKEQQKNQRLVDKFKEAEFKEKRERRMNVNKMEEQSKINISRYKEGKLKDSIEFKSQQYDTLMAIRNSREKELEKLSKMEEEMVKKNSESMQVSQTMKNRLRQVLGDQRRFTKLPSINSKGGSSISRGSTGHTQILLL